MASALVGTNTVLGILPFGRGNDLAKAMGVPSDIAAATGILRTGAIRRIDVGYAHGTPFCTVTSAGFDAEVSNLTRTGFWRHLGPLTYPLGVVAGLLRLRVPMMRVEGDFGVREGPYVLVAASNTGIYGGGIRIAPDSVPDDGLFDCCLVRDIPRWKLLTIFLSFWLVVTTTESASRVAPSDGIWGWLASAFPCVGLAAPGKRMMSKTIKITR